MDEPTDDGTAAEWERHKVVIAATVAALYGDRARILDIKPARQDAASVWARQGRLAIQTSHDLGRQRAAGRPQPARGVANP